MTTPAKPVLTVIRDYFGYKSTQAFSKEWSDLPQKDKDELKAGFQDGSMTY